MRDADERPLEEAMPHMSPSLFAGVVSSRLPFPFPLPHSPPPAHCFPSGRQQRRRKRTRGVPGRHESGDQLQSVPGKLLQARRKPRVRKMKRKKKKRSRSSLYRTYKYMSGRKTHRCSVRSACFFAKRIVKVRKGRSVLSLRVCL